MFLAWKVLDFKSKQLDVYSLNSHLNKKNCCFENSKPAAY